MANEERKIRNKEVSLLLAVRRRKENPEGQTRCHRHIMDTEDYDMESKVVKSMINEPGIWRIYKTINKRSTLTAVKLMQHKLIDHPDINETYVSTWKTCLLQGECKAERNVLIDIDTDDVAVHTKVLDILPFQPFEAHSTPNGIHFIIRKFDRKAFMDEIDRLGIKDVEVKPDAYVFREIFEYKK
jgi:hypothetical protein